MAIRNLSRSTIDLDLGGNGINNNVDGAHQNGPLNLFEQDVPFHVKLDAREGNRQTLGVYVATSRGGPNGTTRCVIIRLTDPRDPFFLFSLTMLEDDYGRFKEQQELNVDFGGFPKHFVAMMTTVSRQDSGHFVEFVTDGASSAGGKMRIVEKTEFRQLEVLTLSMIRENDVGQKHYLAERFIHFENLYQRCRTDSEEDSAQQSATIAELRSNLEAVRMERDDLSEKLKMEASNAQNSQATSIGLLKDEHSREIKRMIAQFEAERNALHHKIDSMQQQFTAEHRVKDTELSGLRNQISTLEATEVHLQSQLRISQETVKAQGNELYRLQQDNEQLSAFRADATKKMSEADLQRVSMTEQIKHLTSSLSKREEECGEFRHQGEKRDNYVQIISDQLREAQEKIKTQEASLAKAHHIIGNQLQQIRGMKDKSQQLAASLHDKDKILEEANTNIERLKGQHSHSAERIDHFQSTISSLKEQLQKVEDQKKTLTEELQSSKDALTHMYKQASSVTPRIHSYANPTNYSSQLYADFSKNMSNNSTAATGGGGVGGSNTPRANTSAAFGGAGVGNFTSGMAGASGVDLGPKFQSSLVGSNSALKPSSTPVNTATFVPKTAAAAAGSPQPGTYGGAASSSSPAGQSSYFPK